MAAAGLGLSRPRRSAITTAAALTCEAPDSFLFDLRAKTGSVGGLGELSG